MAAEFTDPEGRTWHPRVTFGAVTKIKERTGIDLLKVNRITIAEHLSKLLEIVFYSVEQEAEQREVTLEQWRILFEAGPLMPPMEAFKEALKRFTYGDNPPKDEEEADADPTPQ